MRLLRTIIVPWLALFRVGRPAAGVLCFFLQLTIVGWPIAAIWGGLAQGQHDTEERIWAEVGRRYERVPCGDAPCEVWIGSAAVPARGRLIDISMSGAAMRLQGAKPNDIGREAMIRLPGTQDAVPARVARLLPDGVAIVFNQDRATLAVVDAVIRDMTQTGSPRPKMRRAA
jgi:hypothetical protein